MKIKLIPYIVKEFRRSSLFLLQRQNRDTQKLHAVLLGEVKTPDSVFVTWKLIEDASS